MEYMKKMYMKEFINKLKDGDGWRRPLAPKTFGDILDKYISDEDKAHEIIVHFIDGNTGDGQYFRYHYVWNVYGFFLSDTLYKDLYHASNRRITRDTYGFSICHVY